MPAVLCAVDDSAAAADAVRAAVEYCRDHDLDLGLVGVVRTPALDPPQPDASTRMLRFQQVKLGLSRAELEARSAGVASASWVRAGDAEHELCRDGEELGASTLFLSERRPRILARITGAPRSAVRQISLQPRSVQERRDALRRAAA